ncbi:MAG: PD-(D/E)XK nuclease family protein, partial [Sulfurimonas sp.]
MPKLYSFHKPFLKSKEKITLALDGYLTNIELSLLKELAKESELFIEFTATPYNLKMQEKFAELGFDLKVGYLYTLNFSNKEIVTENKIDTIENVVCESFSEDILQIAFIKKKIYDFIEKGYEPQKIAVILPNESKAQLLRSFDKKGNLNFAMGSSFKESAFYTLLDANIKAFEQDSQENSYRQKRVGKD